MTINATFVLKSNYLALNVEFIVTSFLILFTLAAQEFSYHFELEIKVRGTDTHS
jgi:hypothetical protein